MQVNHSFSSVRGKLRKLFMAAPDAPDDAHFERVAAVLDKIPAYCTVIVWCNNAEIRDSLSQYLDSRGYGAAAVQAGTVGEKLPTGARVTLLLPDADNLFFSRWTRDSFLFRKLDGSQVEIIKSGIQKLNDDSWADEYLGRLLFEDGTQCRIGAATVPVAGGNILFDEDFILVGAKQFRGSYEPEDRDDAVRSLLQTFNANGSAAAFNRVVEVGNNATDEPERLAHIDLYLSLTGCVDPSTGRYIVLLARCEGLGNAGDTRQEKMVYHLNKYLDAVAADLEMKNFSVRRNLVPVLKSGANAFYYLCTYNNCLTEVTASGKKVWLPQGTFGRESAPFFARLQEIEQVNAALWTGLGFEAAFIEADFHSIMDDEGALHCITNELFRDP